MASLGNYTTSDNAWSYWAQTTATNTTSTSNSAWNTWCDTGTSATTNYYNASGQNVYAVWVSNENEVYRQHINNYHNLNAAVQKVRVRTAEEIAAAAARIAELAAERAEEEKRRKAAAKRALELLREHLTAKQRHDLENRKFFLVQGGKTGKSYRVRDTGSASGNIDEMADNDNEKVAARLCAHAPYHFDIPNADQLLGQLLMLRFEEEEMLRIANRTPMAA